MIGVDELLSLILADAEPFPPTTDLLPNTWGQVLAEDILAVTPLPPFANAAMDGYAVRRSDLERFSTIAIVADVAAGAAATQVIGPGAGVSISTGAPVPPELDTVVPIEHASFAGGEITVFATIPDHGHIRRAGEDVATGTPVARRGEVVTDPIIMLGQATGIPTARTFPRVRVRLLTVGDELVAVGTRFAPGRTQNVNNELLTGPIRACGCLVHGLASPPDDTARIAVAFAEDDIDVFVTTGGLGPSAHDVVVDAISTAGTVRAFQVAMRPGKAFAFGQVHGRSVYALPGNPGAALAAFHALVAPALRILSGQPAHPTKIQAVLTGPVANAGGRRHYVRATLSWDGPTLAATPTGRQGSGLVSDIVAADALLVIHESVERAEAGDIVHILPLKPLGGS